MKLLHVIFCCSIASGSFAQIDLVEWNKTVLGDVRKASYMRIGSYQVKGSPYLLGQSFSAVLLYKSGKRVTDKMLLYDLYTQKAGMDSNGEIFEANDPLDEFTIALPKTMGGQMLVFKNARNYSANPPAAYLNILEEGEKAILFKAFKVNLVPDPVNYMAKDLRIFDQYSEYYIFSKATKELYRVKAKEKDLVAALGQEKQIKSYVRSNNIDLSREADLVKVVQSYNAGF
jgi:hypothetical protein